MPIAAASSESVKSSRDPVLAIFMSAHGIKRRPTIIITATKAATCANVLTITQATSSQETAFSLPATRPAAAGSSTRIKTQMMSSTTSHPTEIRPSTVFNVPSISRAFKSTTVEAQERHRPKTTADDMGHCQNSCAIQAPRTVAEAI